MLKKYPTIVSYDLNCSIAKEQFILKPIRTTARKDNYFMKIPEKECARSENYGFCITKEYFLNFIANIVKLLGWTRTSRNSDESTDTCFVMFGSANGTRETLFDF